VIEAIKNISDAGAQVIKVIVALDRLEGGRENIEKALPPGATYEALLIKSDLGM
jgi:orotate phosphoribosyltransferase